MDTPLESANYLYEQGMYDVGLAVAQKALEDDPDHGHLWELCGLIHRAREEPAEALHALEMASLLVPLRPLGRFALAECYGHAGHHELAHDLYTSLLDWPDVPTKLLLPIAIGLNQIGNPALALKACREAVRRCPEEAQPWYDMGFYMGRCGYPPHMVETMARKAIALAPDQVNYRIGLTSFLVRNGRAEDGYELIRDLTVQQISEVACRCCLERIICLYERNGDPPRAQLCRAQLLRLAPPQ